jgi:hypothetical protein
MATANLFRWTGLAAILGGVLFPVAAAIHPNGVLGHALLAS